jgi:hypothetical protein
MAAPNPHLHWTKILEGTVSGKAFFARVRKRLDPGQQVSVTAEGDGVGAAPAEIETMHPAVGSAVQD